MEWLSERRQFVPFFPPPFLFLFCSSFPGLGAVPPFLFPHTPPPPPPPPPLFLGVFKPKKNPFFFFFFLLFLPSPRGLLPGYRIPFPPSLPFLPSMMWKVFNERGEGLRFPPFPFPFCPPFPFISSRNSFPLSPPGELRWRPIVEHPFTFFFFFFFFFFFPFLSFPPPVSGLKFSLSFFFFFFPYKDWKSFPSLLFPLFFLFPFFPQLAGNQGEILAILSFFSSFFFFLFFSLGVTGL